MNAPDEITIRILRDFGSEFVQRTGLVCDKSLTLTAYPSSRDGRLWVKCPEIMRRVRSEWVTHSDGWFWLEKGDWEQVEA